MAALGYLRRESTVAAAHLGGVPALAATGTAVMANDVSVGREPALTNADDAREPATPDHARLGGDHVWSDVRRGVSVGPTGGARDARSCRRWRRACVG